MSSFHSIIATLLYYNNLCYKDNLSCDFLKIDYDIDRVKNILLFSYLYFLIDTFIIKDKLYKLHHIITLCALSAIMYFETNLMIACEYLFYAEYPILLFNYIDYLEISNKKALYPLYYKILVFIHWIMMFHSRVYNLGRIGYNCIKYLDWNICSSIIIIVHNIIYFFSFDWIIKRYNYIKIL